jgi:DNA-binding Lrp family transcriptional regulator
MKDNDKKILNIISRSFPIEGRPYSKLAKELSISEDEVLRAISEMKESGLIRRIGATIDPRKIGWYSTLCAAEVPQDKIEFFSKAVNSYAEVTHNYEREGKPNCWFTIIAPDDIRARQIISEIECACGISVREFPARRIFKIGVSFPF